MSSPAASPGLPQSNLIDPRALMAIRSLELRAKVVVEGFWSGIHRSPYHGFSVEFTEYRQYTADDDPRYLDWRVFARSDRYFIKKFEDETNLRCYLMTDASRSMSFSSGSYSKAQYAATLAATLAYFLYLQGDAVGLLSFDGEVREFLPARHRTGHLRQVMIALEKPAEGRATDLGPPLRRIAEIVRKRGLVVFISDFLSSLDQLEEDLTALGAMGHEIIAFQVLDPAELEFTFDKTSLFEDLESGRKLFIDPLAAKAQYLRKLEEHCDRLRITCERLGASYHRLATSQALELALFDLLRARMNRRRTMRRSARQVGAVAGGGK